MMSIDHCGHLVFTRCQTFEFVISIGVRGDGVDNTRTNISGFYCNKWNGNLIGPEFSILVRVPVQSAGDGCRFNFQIEVNIGWGLTHRLFL